MQGNKVNINAINDKTISEVKTRRLEPVLTRTILSGASCLALLASMPAYAQDTGSGILQELEEDEVVATGIRSSLKSAQDIKQNADTFVDAITSEDIGALPDRSVTEALQRVPGVTISRFAAADDPDHFSIEGSDVVVRGLSYVASQFNGRETFSANNGRSLSFADVPPELLGSVQVFKNQTADLIEGGIAGTVSLETVKPFDKAGRVIAGSAERAPPCVRRITTVSVLVMVPLHNGAAMIKPWKRRPNLSDPKQQPHGASMSLKFAI